MVVKTRSLLIAAYIVSAGTLTAQEPLSVTLDEAVAMALRIQPGMVSARGGITNAISARRQVIGSWLPNITGSSSMTLSPSSGRFDPTTQTVVGGGSSTSYSGSLSASIVIFDGLRRNAQGTSTRADQEAAEASLTNQQFQTVLQTKQSYFAVVEGAELVRVADRRIERAEQQLEISRNLLAAGSAIKSDTLRSTVELANAMLQRINSETGRSNALANLARLIGHDGPLDVAYDDALEPTMVLDTSALRDMAHRFSPTVQQSIAQHNSAQAQVRVSRAQYFPSLNASYRRSASGVDLGDLRSSWSASLSLNWPIFNGFNRETNMQRSQVALTVAQAQMEDARRQVDAQLTQQVAAHLSARTSFDIARMSLIASAEDLRVQQERYRVGLATIVDVLASQINVDQAETDEVQARFSMLIAQAQIEALIGEDL